jgi:2,5-diketo-D-gluconate reductase A
MPPRVPSLPLLGGRLSMPQLGLGTYQMRGEPCASAVASALRLGYRLVDTAAVYRNEEDVAEGIRRSGVPREAVFVTSKLRPQDHGDGAYAAALQSLARLSTPYVDLFLVHWPGVAGKKPDDPSQASIRRRTWRDLERLHREGKARAIGVSNFLPRHLDSLAEEDGGEAAGGEAAGGAPFVPPAVNQIELHPLLQQRGVVEACEARGIVVESYATLARGADALLAHPSVLRIAGEHAMTPAQVCLRWAVQRGWVVIPKSTSAERIRENLLALAGADLSEAEVRELNGLEEEGKGLRTCWDPNTIA